MGLTAILDAARMMADARAQAGAKRPPMGEAKPGDVPIEAGFPGRTTVIRDGQSIDIKPQTVQYGGLPQGNVFQQVQMPKFDFKTEDPKPIPASVFNGKQWLRTKFLAAMQPYPGETSTMTASRIRKYQELNTRIEGLPDISEDDAQHIFGQWYGETMPQGDLSQYDRKGEDLLNQIYAPMPGADAGHATFRDANPQQNAAAAAFAIANLIKGGNLGQSLQALSRPLQIATEEKQKQRQQAIADEQQRRQKLVQLFNINQADKGHEQRQIDSAQDDWRKADLQKTRDKDMADRQAADDQRSLEAQAQRAYLGFLGNGDTARAAGAIRAYERITGKTVSDEERRAAGMPTAQEEHTKQMTELGKANTESITKATARAEKKLPYELQGYVDKHHLSQAQALRINTLTPLQAANEQARYLHTMTAVYKLKNGGGGGGGGGKGGSGGGGVSPSEARASINAGFKANDRDAQSLVNRLVSKYGQNGAAAIIKAADMTHATGANHNSKVIATQATLSIPLLGVPNVDKEDLHAVFSLKETRDDLNSLMKQYGSSSSTAKLKKEGLKKPKR